MQWSGGHAGGFSTAAEDDLVVRPVRSGPFGYETRNVAEQLARPGSLLARVGDLVRSRRGASAIGYGRCEVIGQDDPAVLCLCHQLDGRPVLTAVNLADRPATCRTRVRLEDPVELVSDRDYPPARPDPLTFELGPYGYRWFR
jgi:maltose alpha-D-glucosyltransferase/alpha-amylase